MKAFPKSHFSQDVERDHLEPLCNIDTIRATSAQRADFGEKLIQVALHNILLACQRLG